MRTLNFKDVLNGAAQLAGLDRDNLQTHEFKSLRDLADGRLASFWESERWPEMETVAAAAVITTADVDTAALPSDCGEVFGVYNKNPKATTLAAEQAWTLGDGVVYLRATTTPVWIEYRKTRPSLTGDTWSATTAYAVGDQAYFNGNFYNCATATVAGESPASAAAKWSLVQVPRIAQQFLIRGVYADWLRQNEGGIERVGMAEREAEWALLHEADKLYRQQGQVRRLSVTTY